MTKTRFAELAFEKTDNVWRFVDKSTGRSVGPHYPTKAELLADLERFAHSFGCNPEYKSEAPTTLFDVPNLDGLSTESEDYAVAAHVFSTLSAYCTFKETAMAERGKGNVIGAEVIEREMERLYKSLPIWAKW